MRRIYPMKATGIVRRIDDLGRIVIPKEIRRTMRIREGDPLEIFTDNNGDVIFKKYSPIGELSGFAAHYCDALYKAAGHAAAICDRDHVIAVSGVPKKELLERRVSPSLDELMEQRKNYTYTADTSSHVLPVEGVDRKALVINPIIAGGDICGAVMFFCDDTPEPAVSADIKLIQTAAVFLGKQMEE
jgi:AbrB family transcriptional regulator (stage V sporulation protein T)